VISGSPSEDERLEVIGRNQLFNVPFDSFGDRAAHHDPDLYITLLGSFSQICRADQSPSPTSPIRAL
jgi:hypothetical protein